MQDAAASGLDVPVDKHKFTSWSLTDKEVANQPQIALEMFGRKKGFELAKAVLLDIFGVITLANYGAPAIAAITPTNFDADMVVDISTACDTAYWSEQGRSLILLSSLHATLRKDNTLQNASAFGGSEVNGMQVAANPLEILSVNHLRKTQQGGRLSIPLADRLTALGIILGGVGISGHAGRQSDVGQEGRWPVSKSKRPPLTDHDAKKYGIVNTCSAARSVLKRVGVSTDSLLARHFAGDIGELNESDIMLHLEDVAAGDILSRYDLGGDDRVWLLTSRSGGRPRTEITSPLSYLLSPERFKLAQSPALGARAAQT